MKTSTFALVCVPGVILATVSLGPLGFVIGIAAAAVLSWSNQRLNGYEKKSWLDMNLERSMDRTIRQMEKDAKRNG